MRVGLVDVGAAGVVLTLLVLPAPVRPVEDTYTGPSGKYLARIAEAQAEAARRPQSGEAAANLAELLLWAGQSDWALRAAGGAAASKAPDSWRAAWALSKVHAGRLEIEPAYRWAKEALSSCEAEGSTCTDPDRLFLEMRVAGLKECVDSGVDPRIDRKVCQDAVRRIVPVIKGKAPEEPGKK